MLCAFDIGDKILVADCFETIVKNAVLGFSMFDLTNTDEALVLSDDCYCADCFCGLIAC